jgi:hypothetical protein
LGHEALDAAAFRRVPLAGPLARLPVAEAVRPVFDFGREVFLVATQHRVHICPDRRGRERP